MMAPTDNAYPSEMPDDSQFLNVEAAKELVCCICLRVMQNPRAVCGQHFNCESCLVKMKGSSCPTCRNPIIQSKVDDKPGVPAPLIEKIILSQKCLCTQDCGKVLSVTDLDEHVANECSMTPISCPYEALGCSHTFHRKDLADHMTQHAQSHLTLSLDRCLYQDRMLQSQAIKMASLERKLDEGNTAVKRMRTSIDDKLTAVLNAIERGTASNAEKEATSQTSPVGASSGKKPFSTLTPKSTPPKAHVTRSKSTPPPPPRRATASEVAGHEVAHEECQDVLREPSDLMWREDGAKTFSCGDTVKLANQSVVHLSCYYTNVHRSQDNRFFEGIVERSAWPRYVVRFGNVSFTVHASRLLAPQSRRIIVDHSDSDSAFDDEFYEDEDDVVGYLWDEPPAGLLVAPPRPRGLRD